MLFDFIIPFTKFLFWLLFALALIAIAAAFLNL